MLPVSWLLSFAPSPAFYRGSDACILVFDLTSEESLDHLDRWHDEFATQAGQDKDFVLIGNKSDLAHSRVVRQECSVFIFPSESPARTAGSYGSYVDSPLRPSAWLWALGAGRRIHVHTQ